LCAASSGALEAVKCLLEHGANVSYRDEHGRNVIHIAVHRIHTNVLTYFIENKAYSKELKPWNILIGLLESKSDSDRDTSIKCLQLLTSNNKDYWQPILGNQGVEQICAMLRDYTNSFVQKSKEAADKTKKTVTISENLLEAKDR
jgi:ankyrin repeat protein